MFDGSSSDWGGISPIVTDPSGDAGGNDEDIVSAYVTNDGSNIYFMIRIVGSIVSPTDGPPPYRVYLDVDQDPSTGMAYRGIGADYVVAGPLEMDRTYVSVTLVPADPEPVPIGLFLAGFSDGFLEFGCTLSAIGYPDAIDVVFEAMAVVIDTDWAPDTGYVTYDVEPPMIKADGDTTDWAGIDPIVTDPSGGPYPNPDANHPDEDIINCYATDDGETLYVRIDIVGTISTKPVSSMFAVFLDTDSNPNTGVSDLDGLNIGIGADYIALWGMFGGGGEPLMPPMAFLFRTPAPSVMEPIGIVSSQPNEHTIEMAIPLMWVGSPNTINIVFMASLIPGTDVTNAISYVTRIQPVGGVLVPSSSFDLLAPWIGLFGFVGSIALVAVRKKHIN